MHVPKSPLGTQWVAAGQVQLEDNALISSLRAGDAHPAVRPRLSVTSTPLLHPLCLPTWFQPIPDETHCTWTWQLVHQPLRACRIWPQSRGNPMRWQWARTNQTWLPDKSGVWQCLSVPKKVQFSMEQLSGFWFLVRNGSCGLFFPAFIGHCWKICGGPAGRLWVAQDAWCVRVAHLRRKCSLFVRGSLEICACA